MCDRQLEMTERAVLLDGDDAEVVWSWAEPPPRPANDNPPPAASNPVQPGESA